MAEYIEKKKALGIYVLKAFVVDDKVPYELNGVAVM